MVTHETFCDEGKKGEEIYLWREYKAKKKEKYRNDKETGNILLALNNILFGIK